MKKVRQLLRSKGRGNQNETLFSDSSPFRDETSFTPAQAVHTRTRTTTGNHDSTASTSMEHWTQEDNTSHTPAEQIENHVPTPLANLKTTGVAESGAPATVIESSESMPVDEHPTQVKPGLGHSDIADYSEPQQQPLSQPVTEITPSLSNRLWDEAYDEVKGEHANMVTWYEQTLSTRLGRTGEREITPQTPSSIDPFESLISQTDRETRRTQMRELLENWLSEADDEDESEDSDEDADDTEEEADAITMRKILHKAVEFVRPSDALLGWVGVCFASKILLSPKASNRDDCLGLIHVISRMDWYRRLPRLLWQDENFNETQSQLERRIVNLYKAILSYEMNVVCSHCGSLAVSFPSNIYKPREPKNISLRTITVAEEALPLFNEEMLYLPLQKRVSFAEKALARQSSPGDSAAESESDGSSEDISEMLKDLHVHDPRPNIRSLEESQTMQGLYSLLRSREEYMDFCNWEKKKSQLLWISGSAGRGKTMLLKSVIWATSRTTRNDSTPQHLSFFFFDYSKPEANNAAAALRNLIWGVLVRQRNLVKHLENKRSTTGRTTFDDPSDFLALSGILYDITQDEDFLDTYLVIDALDECSSEEGQPGLTDLLKFILDSTQLSERIRWLVSSSFSSTIQSAFSKVTLSHISIDSNLQGCSDTINIYIKNKVEELAEAKGYDEELTRIIVTTLCERSSSNFLWVNIVCEALKAEEKWYAESVLNEVKTIEGLETLFEHFKTKLTSLPRDDGKFCFNILDTVAFANQSLHLSELEKLVRLGPRVDLHSIVQKCNCFLGVADDGTVSFHHQLVRDYHSGSLSYASLTQHRIDSLIRALTKSTQDDESSGISSSVSLHWMKHLYEMVREVIAGNEAGEKLELDPETSVKVVSFLKEHLVAWLDALSLGDDLERAAILLRKVDYLLNAKVDETSELGAAIQDAYLITQFHLSVNTPKEVSASNTLLFCPEIILRNKYLDAAFPQLDALPQFPQLDALPQETKKCILKMCVRDFRSFQGHTDWVRCIAFSPDGRLIASGSDDGTVRIWDAELGTTQHALRIDQGWVYCVAFSSRGHIAAGSDNNSITIWDSSMGRQSMGRQLGGSDNHLGKLRAIAFSPDGKYLAAVSEMNLQIWGFNIEFAHSHDIKGHDDFINSVSFSWDGRLLATGADDCQIRIWDSWQENNSDKPPRKLEGHNDQVNSVAFSPETRPGYLASGSDDGTSKIWDLEKEESECILTLNSGDVVNSISFSPDGLRIASGTNVGRIDIWDAVTGTRLEMVRASTSKVPSVAFSPTRTYLASASYDDCVHLWYMAKKNATKETFMESPEFYASVTELTIAPDGQTIAAGHYSGKVTLWNMNDKASLPTVMWSGHNQITCLAFSPDGSSLASSSSDKTVRILDVATGEERAVFKNYDDWVRSVAWSPDGEYLASGSDDKSVHIYKMDGQNQSLKEVQVMTHSDEDDDWVRAVAFSPDKDKPYLVAGGDNGKLVVWKRVEEEWKLQHTLDAHSGFVKSIVFTPNARRIVSAAADCTLRIWDFETKDFVGETITTRDVHTKMRFEHDRETLGYVMTPGGAQPLDLSFKSVPDWCPYGIKNDEELEQEEYWWITWNNQKVIFLPRAFSPNVTYCMGHKIIVGTESGLVLVFWFSDKEPSQFY